MEIFVNGFAGDVMDRVPVSSIKNIDQCGDEWDGDIMAKYAVAGQSYRLYPAAAHFSSSYTYLDYQRDATSFSKQNISPLSLYIQLPCYDSLGGLCAASSAVTSNQNESRRYLDYLAKEIRLQSALTTKRRTVMQLHVASNPLAFLDGAQLTELIHIVAMNFKLTDSSQREYSIEIDPRFATEDSLALLKGLGFNQINITVQGFDENLPPAVNRRQSFEMLKILTETARIYQFKSVSYQLIYGLPQQKTTALALTLDGLATLSPDRISFYNYASPADCFHPQRVTADKQLLTAEQTMPLLTLISRRLLRAGYRHFGMHHFVRPGDDWIQARDRGQMQRNFQGYSSSIASDFLGLGVSAISLLNASYAQNEAVLEQYYRRLDANEIPISKGLKLFEDDMIRREVIVRLACDLKLDTRALAKKYHISFSRYFSRELVAIKMMENDGLIYWRGAILLVSASGRAILSNICMLFDSYLQPA
jgi:oxygen-independent coproporphyrinogen-3 oxidase